MAEEDHRPIDRDAETAASPPEVPDEAFVAPKVPPSMPKKIGPYKILKTLGEGGMGVVYLAEQTEPVRRTVALKIIKLGMDTKQVIARFEAERQALAMMEHSGVAKVFDAGATDGGRPYFVMEYVPGVPITDYCDRERLDTDERLDLFMQICEAVQHAHQKGIIHRDIKPGNVLVSVKEGKAVPKVIDFGVAKAIHQKLTEKTLFTEQGQLIGTPEYMSPEQAEMTGLDVDTRTDIYSLGVLLYELLTGSLPFEPSSLRQAGFDEIRRVIREDDPSKPSTRLSSLGDQSGVIAKRRRTDLKSLERQLRGDLDWITMKAMEKNRTRRYATASELGRDVARHFAGDAIDAAPPSATYLLSRTIRRHRGLLNTAVSLGVGWTALYYTWMALWRFSAYESFIPAVAFYVLGFALLAAPLILAIFGGLIWWACRSRIALVNAVIAGLVLVVFSVVGFIHETWYKIHWYEDSYEITVQNQSSFLADYNHHLFAAHLVLGSLFVEQDKCADAEPLLRGALVIAREDLRDGYWLIPHTMSILGASLAGQGDFQEAEQMLLGGYTQLTDSYSVNREAKEALGARTNDACERVIDLYTAWHEAEPDEGYDAKAAEWRARLDHAGSAQEQGESPGGPESSDPPG